MSNSSFTERLLITKSAKTGLVLGKFGFLVGKWSAVWMWRLGLAGTASVLTYMKLMVNGQKDMKDLERNDFELYILENLTEVDDKEALLRYGKQYLEINKILL